MKWIDFKQTIEKYLIDNNVDPDQFDLNEFREDYHRLNKEVISTRLELSLLENRYAKLEKLRDLLLWYEETKSTEQETKTVD